MVDAVVDFLFIGPFIFGGMMFVLLVMVVSNSLLLTFDD
jgi:hypothetical protein